MLRATVFGWFVSQRQVPGSVGSALMGSDNCSQLHCHNNLKQGIRVRPLRPLRSSLLLNIIEQTRRAGPGTQVSEECGGSSRPTGLPGRHGLGPGLRLGGTRAGASTPAWVGLSEGSALGSREEGVGLGFCAVSEQFAYTLRALLSQR